MKVHAFKYSYSAEIEINAAKERVWEVLRNSSSYAEWNAFTPVIKTSWKVGDPVILTVQMKPSKNAIQQKEVLLRLDPPNEMSWGMHWGLFLRAERRQVLTESNSATTTYFTEDVIKGMLSPIVHKMYGKYIQRGFEKVASALKEFVEK